MPFRRLELNNSVDKHRENAEFVWHLLAFVVLAVSCHCPSAECAPLFQHGLELRGVVVPFAVEGSREPSSILRVQRVFTDYETKGFFRIGVLPIEVMQGVALEVRQPRELASALADLHQWLGAKTAKRLELRDLSVVLPVSGGTTNRLEATRVRVLNTGRWEFLDSVTYSSGADRVSASRGSLQLTGPNSGLLMLQTTPTLATNLLLISQTP